MRETEKASDVLKILRDKHGCFTFNIAGSYYQRSGMPDSCVITNGVHLWIEFKGATTKIEPLQLRVIQQMREVGANVFLVRFLEQKQWLINEFYSIKFSNLREGVELLLRTLIGLCKDKENVSILT